MWVVEAYAPPGRRSGPSQVSAATATSTRCDRSSGNSPISGIFGGPVASISRAKHAEVTAPISLKTECSAAYVTAWRPTIFVIERRVHHGGRSRHGRGYISAPPHHRRRLCGPARRRLSTSASLLDGL